MTAQVHERLIVDGAETSMAFCPPLPKGHPRIESNSGPDADDSDEGIIRCSTACWRGYQGVWEIKEDRFYLIGLRGGLRLLPGPQILADWFTGVLRVPLGEMLQYVHMGFGSVYEQELHLKIEQGVVVARRTIDNRGRPHDREQLGWENLPGSDNRFPGDDEL